MRYISEASVASGQDIGLRLACHEFELSNTKDPMFRGEMHFKSVESSSILSWCGVVVRRGGASSDVVLVTGHGLK
ncbi:hypothetical protein TNCV_1975461 [Trichonephila clavipes]|nr:hypothetical protein TNCV_1975461 [Trichonephila clavipes]